MTGKKIIYKCLGKNVNKIIYYFPKSNTLTNIDQTMKRTRPLNSLPYSVLYGKDGGRDNIIALLTINISHTW